MSLTLSFCSYLCYAVVILVGVVELCFSCFHCCYYTVVAVVAAVATVAVVGTTKSILNLKSTSLNLAQHFFNVSHDLLVGGVEVDPDPADPPSLRHREGLEEGPLVEGAHRVLEGGVDAGLQAAGDGDEAVRVHPVHELVVPAQGVQLGVALAHLGLREGWGRVGELMFAENSNLLIHYYVYISL